MEFRKYQHVERFGTSEVEGIEIGECYVFPKIDGTNSSVWIDDDAHIHAGSRKRELSLESDNAGFFEWVSKQDNIYKYLLAHPNHRLFGEWLVPHSLKTYRDSAWKRFYVFDVCVDLEQEKESDEKFSYITYDFYKSLLEEFSIDYIPPICKVINGSHEQFVDQLIKNVFLVEDGKGVGEGIVIKNYDYTNKYGRKTWAKIVTSEFKEKHSKEMGGFIIKGKKLVEQEIANKYVTQATCDKVLANINNDGGFTSKQIPRLLNTVYYDVIREESWNFVKEFKNPIIDYSKLQRFVTQRIKELLPMMF